MTEEWVSRVLDVFIQTQANKSISLTDHLLKLNPDNVEISNRSQTETRRRVYYTKIVFKKIENEKSITIIFKGSEDSFWKLQPKSSESLAMLKLKMNETFEANKSRMAIPHSASKSRQVPSLYSENSANRTIRELDKHSETSPSIRNLTPSVSYKYQPTVSTLKSTSSPNTPKSIHSVPHTSSINSSYYVPDKTKNLPNSSTTYSQNKEYKPLQPTRRVYDYSSKQKIYSYRSLHNIKNTCYFNATLQALASCPSMVSRFHQMSLIMERIKLRSFYSENTDIKNKLALFVGFQKVFMFLTKPEKSTESFNRDELKRILENLNKVISGFIYDKQQDVQEFLDFTFHAIDDIMKNEMPRKEAIGDESSVFYGGSIASLNPLLPMRYSIESSKSCCKCDDESTVIAVDHFLRVSMQPSDGFTSVELTDLITNDFKAKKVERDCSKCKCESAISRDRFVTFPQCLAVHLKRSCRDENQTNYKNEHDIKIRLELDLSKYSSFCPIAENANTSSSKLSVKNFNSNLEKNHTPLKVLGGAREVSLDTEEVQFDNEIINHSLHFKPLRSYPNIVRMLEELDIKYDDAILRTHVKKLAKIRPSDMTKNDEPDQIQEIEADGNCFFRAISWCLTGSEAHHKKLRRATADYLKDNKPALKKYQSNFEAHAKKMKQNAEWATNCEVAAISKMLSVNIYTYLSSGWTCQSPSNNEVTVVGSIYLNNVSEHYEPVLSLRKGQSEARSIRAQKRSAPDSDDEKSMDDNDESFKPARPKMNGDSKTSRKEASSSKGFVNDKKTNTTTKDNELASYNLVAVICHYGPSVLAGHYITFSKSIYCDEWLKCDDETITPVSKNTVLTEATSAGYLIFYDRK
ncbi:hypothetical protein L5515_001523 [Caenorhabditis briggsae]|uniref:Uncharacterized protein n=1 Tax=Caenorhabditis briggsae TaxID=6238 RepID=A0AAE9DVD0_CAEBR|nr:hypothetical protein L3Y34_015446 [Caenorhabditis briggsae]UMM13052.1 hypothetical protein L5515_001523 [Caenorhabditis briggsae]